MNADGKLSLPRLRYGVHLLRTLGRESNSGEACLSNSSCQVRAFGEHVQFERHHREHGRFFTIDMSRVLELICCASSCLTSQACVYIRDDSEESCPCLWLHHFSRRIRINSLAAEDYPQPTTHALGRSTLSDCRQFGKRWNRGRAYEVCHDRTEPSSNESLSAKDLRFRGCEQFFPNPASFLPPHAPLSRPLNGYHQKIGTRPQGTGRNGCA